MRSLTPLLALAAAAMASVAVYAGPPIDSVVFGNAVSEASHGVAASASDTITGGLGISARRLVPLSPVSYEGGRITFTLKVDGSRANHVTFKLWGSDHGEKAGRLLLFSGEKQIGYRDQGDYDVVNQMDDVALAPGRFVYVTLPLPRLLTDGRSQIELTLRSLGPLWFYGTSFAQAQKPMAEASRGIYAAYTHVEARFDPPAGEEQGMAPAMPVRATPGPETMSAVRERVNSLALSLASAPTRLAHGDIRAHHNPLLFLSEAYVTPWTSVFGSQAALNKMIREGDAIAQQQSVDPAYVASDWMGAGGLGEALLHVYPALAAAGRLDETITLPGGAQVVRRAAWSAALRASVDYWRTHRRFYTNQSMIVDRNIYTANEGLRMIDPSGALPKEQALHYLYEAAGIEPLRGSDPADLSSHERGGGMDLPAGGYSHLPYGAHYSLVTRKGLSRELGFVGSYGETILHFMTDMVRLTHDPALTQQLIKIERARTPFRYPLADADGNRAMFLESVIDNRTAHYPSYVAYGAAEVRETEPMEVAAVTGDPVAIGCAKQCLDDNQFFQLLDSRLHDSDPLIALCLMRAVDDYKTVLAQPATSYRLPMSDGQPDFAWADEEDAVLALRHGDEKLFVNFYYRSERGINGVVRIHEITPNIERIVTTNSRYQFVSSDRQYTRNDWIDGIRGRGFPPPDEVLHQAWAGEVMPISARPADAILPAYGDWGPFVGKAAFYSLRYGDFVIAMNCSEDKAYTLQRDDVQGAFPDLISGKTATVGAGGLSVAPLTTVVLWLGR
ncbi:MAG: hypothetical protein P4L33_11430 [Capsulimonadaceae bacterium]|nr:hypothetical protein [Capsulimonadaceae bacterium]